MIKFKSLNQNKQFLRIFKKKKLNTKYFTIYFENNSNNINKNLNISFAMKKKHWKCRKKKQDKAKIKGSYPKNFKGNTSY